MSSDSDEGLRAASFDPRPNTSPIQEEAQKPPQRGLWATGIVGLALLGFVIFVLPSFAPDPAKIVSSEDASLASSDATVGSVSGNNINPPEKRSPFAEAQMAKARRAAQEALQQLLETQARLEARAVIAWAESEFNEATTIAVEGDLSYREQNFGDAATKYQTAQALLDALEARLPEEVSARLSALLLAIEASDEKKAARVSQTLSQMAPDNADVAETVERVPTIPEVAALINEAGSLFAERDFRAAVDTIQNGIKIDPDHQRLRALSTDYRNALTNDQFQKAMTRGFEALEAGDFAAAKTAFESAATLKPGDNSPNVALDQAEEAAILSALNQSVSDAERFEKNEDWEAAAKAYRDALALDGSLVQALEGLAQAEPMADLFLRLDNIVEKAARLVDPLILGDAQTTVAEANGALSGRDAMPRLKALATKAQRVVDNASTPLPVTITSDGATEITIKRVARLNTLTSRTLSLRPGQYQLLGSRVGFRDVLVTLNVGLDRENAIDIRCTEVIGR